MKMLPVTMVRIYITEADKLLKPTLAYLHDEFKASGVTVFRAISGFGKTGIIHTTNLIDLSLNLPVVIEFFDIPERVDIALAYLDNLIDEAHIVTWSASVNVKGK